MSRSDDDVIRNAERGARESPQNSRIPKRKNRAARFASFRHFQALDKFTSF